MRFRAIYAWLVAATALLVVACATPEPVVERVETTVEVPVTRIVQETVEVPVTQLVEATVEVPVTVVMEQTVEVTREVQVTVVVTATPLPATPTPLATPTPRPTATPRSTPTPKPTPVDLEQTTRANAWVYITNEYDWLRVVGDPAFDVPQYELDVFVDGHDCSNDARIYGDDGGLELVCGIIEKGHTSVQRVSIQTPFGDLRCARNKASDASETVFACAWR